MNLLIFGGTGLIGQRLAQAAAERGDTVWIPSRGVSRGASSARFGTLLPYDRNSISKLMANMASPYAVVNLAGESLQNGRWTAKRKRLIYNSRIQLTEAIVSAIGTTAVKPIALINASAIGYYGYDEQTTFTEQDGPGEGFLAKVTTDWEGATLRAEEETRVVLLRTGVVLSNEGGALPAMVAPYRMYVGGRVGSGRQWVSWIHMDDAVRLILHAVQKPEVRGPVNLTAPNPVRMDEFGRTIAQVTNRPHLFPVPAFALRALFGSKAELVLHGQRVLPKVAESTGFVFRYPQLKAALEQLLRAGQSTRKAES